MLTEYTTAIVSAYVANNAVPASEVPGLMATVHTALAKLGQEQPAAPLVPAVSIKHSIQPDHIVCLEDGKKFQSLKRHLGTLGMSPAEYRARWNLPKDYPMTAPAYAAARSELAKRLGLGRKRPGDANATREIGVAPAMRPAEPADGYFGAEAAEYD